MVNRDRHDIVIDILKKASSGKNKTELMRDVNLSFSQSRLYLGNLLENELLEVDERRRFKTTKKGLEFLKKCEECPLFTWHKLNEKSLVK
jgi:predicted transcriptional regulator